MAGDGQTTQTHRLGRHYLASSMLTFPSRPEIIIIIIIIIIMKTIYIAPKNRMNDTLGASQIN